MRYTKVFLTNNNRVPFALSNEFNNTFDLEDDIFDCPCDDIAKLTRIVNSYSRFNVSWKVARDNEKYTRLNKKDRLGNEYFLICYKESNNNDG